MGLSPYEATHSIITGQIPVEPAPKAEVVVAQPIEKHVIIDEDGNEQRVVVGADGALIAGLCAECEGGGWVYSSYQSTGAPNFEECSVCYNPHGHPAP